MERLRPKDLGFIIRTAGDGVREADLEADIRYLRSIWEKILLANDSESAPAVLHEEHELPLRIVRDIAGPDAFRIVVDDLKTHKALTAFVEEFVADPKPEIEHYSDSIPIFDALKLETQIHANLERKVWLKSGGSLVIDQGEALTAIDVNTGGFVGKRNLEETVFRNNMEAVREVVRQLRFRNIGGLIIIDLIDMESAEHRNRVYQTLQDAIRSDRARNNILKISELGLVEMTRKRTRENLVQTLCEPCNHCEGRGYMLSTESVAYNILREIRNDLPRFSGRQIAISAHPRVAEQLLAIENEPLESVSAEIGREIEVRAKPGLHQEQFEVEALDAGPPVTLALGWLRDPAEIAADEAAEKKAQRPSPRGGRGGASRSRRRGSSKEEATQSERGAEEPEAGEDSQSPDVPSVADAALVADSPEAAEPAPSASILPPEETSEVGRD